MGNVERRRQGESATTRFFNRVLTGEDGTPVNVRVEVIENTPDIAVQHRLHNTSDFDTYDFFLPLGLLVLVFFFQFIGANLFALFVQAALVNDLVKRVRRRPSGEKMVGLVKPYPTHGWGWAFGAYLACAPLVFGAAWLNGYVMELLFPSPPMFLPGNELEYTGNALLYGMAAFGLLEILIFFFMTVVFAPVTEELWFRGIGLAGFLKNSDNRLRAVLWTSLIFGLLHGPGRFLFASMFGVVLAFIRIRTGSLYCSMAVHAFHNFAVVVYAVIYIFYYISKAAPF